MKKPNMEQTANKVVNIEWDVDNKSDLKRLPTEIPLPDDIDPDDDDEVSDYISDLTGFCHTGFEVIKNN